MYARVSIYRLLNLVRGREDLNLQTFWVTHLKDGACLIESVGYEVFSGLCEELLAFA